jgi:acyl-CoA thioesterase FadM
MSRIQIDLPEDFHFEAALSVRITDLNYGGHLGNDAILSFVHEARLQFLQHYGFKDELAICGLGLIMADAGLQFRGEGLYGDTWHFKIAATNLHKRGFDLYYQALNQEGKEVLRAKTGMLMFDYKTRKLAPLPKKLEELWG